MRTMSFLVGLGIGLAALPCLAGSPTPPSPDRVVVAFLSAHGVAAQSPGSLHLVACKAEGGACTDDSGCCDGICKPAGEGRVCMTKTAANADPGTPSQKMPNPKTDGGSSDNMQTPAQNGHVNPTPKEQSSQSDTSNTTKTQ